MQSRIVCFEIVFNIISFSLMRIDKYNAIKAKRRISEKALLLFTLIAPIGTACAMIFPFINGRHKSRKPIFIIGVIGGIALHILFFYLMFKFNFLF